MSNKRIIKAKSKTFKNISGEGYIDVAVKIVLAAILGVLVIETVTNIFNDIVLPGLAEKIADLFNIS